ncbi:MAG: hypothetical protein QM751_00285 [Paludibacteraceae bacterium]
MIVSLIVYIIFNKLLPSKSITKSIEKQNSNINNTESSKMGRSLVISLLLMGASAMLIQLIPGLQDSSKLGLGMAIGLFVAFVSYIFQIATKDERPRIVSLILVFVVVIFFWMSIPSKWSYTHFLCTRLYY